MTPHRPWLAPAVAAVLGALLATTLTGVRVGPSAWSQVDRTTERAVAPIYAVGQAAPPGWKAVVDGLSPVDQPATFRLTVPPDPQGRPTALWLVLGQPAGMRVMVRHSADGQAWREIWRGGAGEPGRLVDLGPEPAGVVEVVAWRASWHTGRPDMAIKAIDVIRGAPRVPDLPGWLLVPLLAAVLALFGATLAGDEAGPWVPALVGVGGAAAIVGALMFAGPRPAGWGVWVVAAVAALTLRGRAHAAIVLAATYAALVWRWDVMVDMVRRPLERDVIGYVEIAAAMAHPYDTSFREPLFAWMIAALRPLTGELLAPRLLSLAAGVALVPAVAWLGRRLISPAAGTVAAVGFVSSHWLMLHAVRGYRFEWYLLLGIAFLGGVLGREKPRDWALGLLGALLLLLRMSATAPVAVGLGWAWWRGGRGWGRACALLLPAVAAVAPHLWHNASTFDDPMHSVNIHARYYRNYEFAGTGSHLTVEQLEPDRIYAGPPISVSGYLFGLHTIPQLVEFQAQGVYQILAGGMAQSQYYADGRARQLLCLVGLLLWLAVRRRWGLLLALVLVWGPAPAILQATVILDPRLVYTTAPLLELAAAEALVTVALALSGLPGGVEEHDPSEPVADAVEPVVG